MLPCFGKEDMIEENSGKTEDFSILDHYGKELDPVETQAFYQDLNLLQILDKLAAKWGRGVKRYFRYLPDTAEAEAYRRAVYADIKKPEVYEALMRYIRNLSEVEELREERAKVSGPMQRAVWQIREMEKYCSTYEELKRDLSGTELSSEGMLEFMGILKDILESGGFLKMQEQTRRLIAEIRKMRFVITYDRDRMSVALGEVEGEGAYAEMLKKEGGSEKGPLKNPFRADPAVTALENACLEILQKKKPEFFKELENTAESAADYERKVLKRFEGEITFYLSYRGLQLDMEKEGYHFAAPGTDDDKCMEAEGLYDMALALTAMNDGRKVIPNNFYYEKTDRFFVLTGPNQGGKTTFARSLGQLVYFTRVGLDVPAVSANVPFFSDIQTHFSVEESIETGRGKLKEELVRLVPMMGDRKKGSFVIINELFTTAASYDAIIMGKKVLGHFIGLECMGIYVTHLKELANEHEGIVSMRAMLNDKGIQTFEIRRGAAEDTPCAENQVNKYRLTYEQLKERL